MRKYRELEYLGLGRIGFSVPGFVRQDGDYIAFAQSDPVFRVALNTTNAAWLDIDIIATGGWRGTDPLSCSQHIAVGATDTVYVPMADVIRAAFIRTFTGITSTPSKPAVTMSAVFTVLDSSLTTLEITTVDMTCYDALGNYAQRLPDWRLPGIPDKFRLFKDRDNYITFPCAQFQEMVNDPYSFVQYLSDGSTFDYTFDTDGSSRVFKVRSATALYTTALGYREDSGDMSPIFTAQAEWLTCGNDHVMLVWWSPELGGWKTVVADVVSTSDGVTEREAHVRGFERANGTAARLSLALRLPLLTQTDYFYYRDLLFSDEVYMDEWILEDYDGGGSTIRKAVRVSGDAPAWKTNDVKDLEFTITYDYLSEL